MDFFFKTNHRPLLGLDIGEQHIKLVELAKDNGQLRLVNKVRMNTPKGVIQEGQVQDVAKLAQVLRTLHHSISSSCHEVAIAVAGTHVMSKIITMSVLLSAEDLAQQIDVEAEQALPFPIDEVNLDFEVLGRNAADSQLNDVLLSGIRSEPLNNLIESLAQAKLTPKVVDISYYALARGILACLPPHWAHSDIPLGIADIGASNIHFAVVLRGEVVYTRQQPFGGQFYTNALMSAYGLSFEDAEAQKLSQILPEDYESQALQPYIAACIQQLKRIMQIAANASGFRQLEHVAITGGAVLMPKAVTLLQAGFPAVQLYQPSPFETLGIDDDGVGSDYMLAFGLALRSFIPCQL